MSRIEKVESDLSYVRSIVDRTDVTCSPPAIYFLWAAIGLVGFGLNDFRPDLMPVYWSIAGPGGGLLSFFLGWAWSRKVGQTSMTVARYHALHWIGMMVAVFLLVPLRGAGLIENEGLARAILIVLAFGYFTAGIYLVRGFLWIGLAVMLGYLALFLFEAFTWTSVGALFAGSLVWAGIRELAGGRARR